MPINDSIDYYPFGMQMPGRVMASGSYRYGFNSQEQDNDIYGNGNSYTASFWQYDSRLGRRWNVDPLASERAWVSTYNFVQDNPINRVDQTGALDNPIYDENANFLGTDDQGLQGEAIIMDKKDFKQSMSHEDALEKGKLRSDLPLVYSQESLDKIDNHVASLPDRPDYDGQLTFHEAIDWYHTGNGQPLYIDVGKINFKSSRLTVDDFSGANKLAVNFFIVPTHLFNQDIKFRPSFDNNLSCVYGVLMVQLDNPNYGTISLVPLKAYGGAIDKFDFNEYLYKLGAKYLRSKGNPTEFKIFGYGEGKINLSSLISCRLIIQDGQSQWSQNFK